RDARDRDPHLVVDALPLHQIPGPEDAGPRAHAGLIRFALLDRLVRRVARTAHGRDAEREKGPTLRLAEIRLQVRVELRQARHHGQIRRVDDLTDVVRIRVRHDARDPVALDDHVDVRTGVRRLHVDEPARMYDQVRRRHRRGVFQVERYRTGLAGLDI